MACGATPCRTVTAPRAAAGAPMTRGVQPPTCPIDRCLKKSGGRLLSCLAAGVHRWREMLEHLGDGLVQAARIFLRLVRECLGRNASPDSLFGPCVEKINDQRPHLVGAHRCSGG